MQPIHRAAWWRAAVLAMAASIALLASACGGSSPTSSTGSGSTTGQSTAYQKAIAYAQCIRKHGVPNYPDPNSQGQFFVPNGDSPTSNVSKTVGIAAAKACHKLLPPSMAQGPPQGSQGAKAASRGLRYSECMRSHGEPNFPDPGANGSITLPPGMNYQSPQFQNASKDCQSLRSVP